MSYSYAKWLPRVYRVMETTLLECFEELVSWCTRGSPACVPRDKRRHLENRIIFPIISCGSSADTLPKRNRTKEGTCWGKNWCDDKTNWKENTEYTAKIFAKKIMQAETHVTSSSFLMFYLFFVCLNFSLFHYLKFSKIHIAGFCLFACLFVCFSWR